MGSMENPLTGIFSTFSPARPNPILVTVAKLHKREGNILHVSGLDAIDGSPVIDIKPYVREFYPQEETRIPDWIQRFLERREPDTD
jgi:tRNA (Thr-GGU) A37 N-methylase